LLKAIEILINDLVRARYPYASVTEAMTRFMTCRQLENKPLANYVKRFKSYQDSMAQNIGKDFLKDFLKNTKQYADETNTGKQDKMLKGWRWKVSMLMKKIDQSKYGLLMTSLTTQFSMGTNQYPKAEMAAADILTNHTFDKKEPKNNNQRNRNWNNDNTSLTITTGSSFIQEALKRATCYCCSRKGHYLNKCPEKDKRSKDGWAVKKAMKKEPKKKMTMTMQAKLCGDQTRAINRENGIISFKKKRAYTTTVSSGHLTPKKTASYWTTDQR
jgi:hypothetical protein